MATTRSRTLSDYFNAKNAPFWIAHVIAAATVAAAGWDWNGLWWTALVYAVGMFFVTAGYHRYFSHRSFRTSRWFQFVLAIGAQVTCQKGVLWWASRHRHHHRTSDTEQDIHSAAQSGFLWSHLGWFLAHDNVATERDEIRDLSSYRELRWMNRRFIDVLPALIYSLVVYAIGGLYAAAYAAFLPLVLVWHGTFLINSLAHVLGTQTYDTGEQSKNNFVLALITLGEGWHNNHHHYQRSCRQGFRWWQIDITYSVLCLLAALGIVWDLTAPPNKVVAATRRSLTSGT